MDWLLDMRGKLPYMGISLFFIVGLLSGVASAQTQLETFQTRLDALEEGMKDIRRIIEEDFHDLKQSVRNSSDSEGGLTALENKVDKLVDILRGLNQHIERSLKVGSDNELRLLQLEKRVEGLIGLGLNNGLASGNGSESDLLGDRPQGNSGAAEAPSPSLSANENSEFNWEIGVDTLEKGLEELSENQAGLGGENDSTSVTNPIEEEAVSADGTLSILPDQTPDEQFHFALGLALQNDFATAEQAFLEFIDLHPDYERLRDIIFWLGRVQFRLGSYDKASVTLSDFNTRWPTDPRREKAVLWIAESVTKITSGAEACELLTSLPRLLEDPSDNFYDRLDKLKQTTECDS